MGSRTYLLSCPMARTQRYGTCQCAQAATVSRRKCGAPRSAQGGGGSAGQGRRLFHSRGLRRRRPSERVERVEGLLPDNCDSGLYGVLAGGKKEPSTGAMTLFARLCPYRFAGDRTPATIRIAGNGSV